jgi:DNA-directed RNA polymerase subunit F
MTTQIESQEPLEQFVDRLLQEKQLSQTDPEILTELKNDLLSRVENHVNAAILAEIPGDKLDEFNALLESGNSEQIVSYCQANVPDFQNVIATTLNNFRNIYLGA